MNTFFSNGYAVAGMALAMILALAFLVGSPGKPSSGIVAQVLSERYEGIAEIAHVRKLDGYESSEGYVVVTAYNITFTISHADLMAEMKATASKNMMAEMNLGLYLMMLQIQFGEWEAGDSYDMEEAFTFIKSEQGWRLQS